MHPGIHLGIAGPLEMGDLLPLLPEKAKSWKWASQGSPLLTTLISNLLARGVRLALFTTDAALETLSEPWVRFETDKLTLYAAPQRRRAWRFVNGRPGRMVDFFALERRGLESAIRHARPDIVHAHWSYEYGAAALAAGLPTLLTCHDAPWTILRHMPDAYRLLRLILARRVLREAKHLTVVSPYLIAPISRMTDGAVQVVPNPMPQWVFDMDTEQVKVSPSAEGQLLKIGMLLNGWISRKNPVPAMQAMSIISKTYPLSKMHLLGPGYGDKEPAAKWAQKHGVSELFVFHGAVPHRAAMDLLAQMHMLVHPALEEAGSLSVTEAMALGLPVVGGADSGAVPWIIAGGAAGQLVDVRDPADIARGVLRLAADSALYDRCSAAARQRARTTFSEESVTDEYFRCYEAVLAGRFAERTKNAQVHA